LNSDNNIYYIQPNCIQRVSDDDHEIGSNKNDNIVDSPLPKFTMRSYVLSAIIYRYSVFLVIAYSQNDFYFDIIS
jgi:hypothetical protein